MTKYSYFDKGRLVATANINREGATISDADDAVRRLGGKDPLKLTCCIGVRVAAFDLHKSKTIWTSKVYPGTRALYFDEDLTEQIRRRFRYNPGIRLFVEVPSCGEHRPRKNYIHGRTT